MNLRETANQIIRQSLQAVDPAEAVKRALILKDGSWVCVGDREIDLNAFTRIVAVGAGKAGQPMSRALEQILGDRLEGGLVVVKDGHGGPTERVRIVEAGHPIPDQRGVAASRKIAAILEGCAERTLVLCLISGGGSALMPAPVEGISLADKQETTRLLLGCGAEIGEINAIRKHLSFLKGGGLVRLAAPAMVVSLIISDVVADRLDAIASGPTVADNSTWQDCHEILERYGIRHEIPDAVRRRVAEGLSGRVPDTIKPGNPLLDNSVQRLIATNRQCLDVAAQTAQRLGFFPMILSSTIEGETREVARVHTAILKECLTTGNPAATPCCLISGGETTITLGRKHGKGGRNQEFALAAALELAGVEGVLAVSFGTDGTDGPTEAAGAWADGRTYSRARSMNLNPRSFLEAHDAYNFFKQLDDLIVTGPTRTNVMDIRLMLAGGKGCD
jgi:hydroxypyruvate reductase